jgi:hypothetical protein
MMILSAGHTRIPIGKYGVMPYQHIRRNRDTLVKRKEAASVD